MRFLTLTLILASIVNADERSALTSAIVHKASSGPYVRYVWMQTDVDPAVVDLAMNLACPSYAVSDIIRGEIVSPEVIAYDLSLFDPLDPDRLTKLWDSLAGDDPIFHLSEQLQVEIPEDVPSEGDGTSEEGEERESVTEPLVTRESIAILPPHLSDVVAKDLTNRDDKRLDVILTELSSSPAPIYEARFLIEQLLDKRYYKFRGLEVGQDIAEPLARAGFFIGTNKEQYTLRTNYLIRSNITGNQRVVIAAYGTAGPTPATITYDQFDGTIQPEKQFIRNLDTFQEVADGSEIFVPMANGLIEFMLADSEAKIVTTAPPNLAVDFTKPNGHDADLRPAISCLACHIMDQGKGMYRSFGNDYEKLPVTGLNAEQRTILRKLYNRTLDEADGVLGRARRDFVVSIAPLAGAEEDAENMLIGKLVQAVRDYRYEMLTPEIMSSELGLPDGTKLSDVITIGEGELIDPEVYLAVKGVPLSRASWNVVRMELASRVSQNPISRVKNDEPKVIVSDDDTTVDVPDEPNGDSTAPEVQQP